MRSRASLLAELEEKHIENSKVEINLEEESLSIADDSPGCDPYDNRCLDKKTRSSD